MSNLVILPSKRVVDVRTISIDFGQRLTAGETIVDASVEVSVFSGIDPSPIVVLDGLATITGTIVGQKIKEGLVGVVYLLTFTAETSTGRLVIIVARQAVLPNNMPVDPLFTPLYLTSRPYPIDVLESFVPSIAPQGGYMLTIIPDEMAAAGSLFSGELRVILLTYSFMEEFEIGTILESGELRVILQTYVFTEETDIDAILLSGELKVILISYTNFPVEATNVSANLVSGSLL